MKFGTAIAIFLLLATGDVSYAGETPEIPAHIAAALADPARPAADIARDRLRKPGEAMAFAGLKSGDRIADFMSGGGYFTRIFARAVGPGGRVYAFVPDEEMKNCDASETDGSLALGHDRSYANVDLLTGPVNAFAAPEKLDMVWTAQNYHDLHDDFMGPADLAAVNRHIYASLRPGGVFLVIDHVAEAGSGVRDTATLHRIDPQTIIREVEAAGFRLEAQSDVLRNPADTHLLRVFDPTVRGRTDQVVLKFRKPDR
jgi:predicted methyltransferase